VIEVAKKSVLVIECDKCKTSSSDTKDFFHVTIQQIADLNDKKSKPTVVSVKDLCKSCIGAPGVNVEP
jgi:hypothetical protein